jgi:DNA/RNA endonuclease YhcR with UshA esterase domain
MKFCRTQSVILGLAVFSCTSVAQAPKTIPSAEAAQHAGETGTVCGYVASTRYLSTSRAKPTFLNLGKPYPNEDFTVVIWSEDRAKFGQPETKYLHKNICVTGEITLYRGSPEIIAKSSAQITEQ